MKTPEYRTTPPREQYFRIVGLVFGLLLSYVFLQLWLKIIPAIQSRYWWLYVKSISCAYLGAFAHIKSWGNQYHRLAPSFHVAYPDGFFTVFFWPILLGIVATITFFALGLQYDKSRIAELRKGRKIDGPDMDSVKEFNQRHKKDERGFGLLVEN